MGKLAQYLLLDLLKNRIVIGSFVLFAFIGWGAFLLESRPEKAVIVLLQVSLLALPLITLIFGSIYYYNATDLITVLLAQPIRRSVVIRSLYSALTAAFIMAYLAGIGLPLMLQASPAASWLLIIMGLLIIAIFVAISLWISASNHDRVRGMGVTLILWTFFAFVFDGILLYLMFQFADYPIEKLILMLSFLNPIDIGRIAVIMQTDASALLGLSGAIFTDFFGTTQGLYIILGAMAFWALFAFYMARRKFAKIDH